MYRIIKLIKVSLNHDMNIFKINTKKQSKFSKIILPLLLAFYIMFLFGMYAVSAIKMLKPMHLEFVVLTLFGLAISFLTFIEGVYKSGSLLFNCKDDNLLLSLPIKKSVILFVRIFKFYAFEFLYNSLFLLPAMVIYAVYLSPPVSYYISSVVALFILPIVPVILSCLFGFVITKLSSRFKGKNIIQTIITTIFLLLIFYFAYNSDGLIASITKNASNINDIITKIYYPVGVYISLVTDFKILTLLLYIVTHILVFGLAILILSKLYFNINSDSKRVLISHKKGHINIKKHSKMLSFIKKEINRFVTTPVFITNAGFGLVLFLIACIFFTVKYNSLDLSSLGADIDTLMGYYMPVIMFGMVCFTSFMTSITSSMISLEGKSFSILKTLPIRNIEIVFYKIIAALVIMIPFILLGDIVIFVRFKFDFLSIMLILLASLLLPFLSELIGIMVNLKYPKMDASNDTEIVKQSMSSMISVFIGMGLLGISAILLFKMADRGVNGHIIMMTFLLGYLIITILLLLLLHKKCDKLIKNIN